MIQLINILIIEDDIEIQHLLSSFLRKHHYNVLQAFDGLEALHLFESSIDLVLLDVMLPKLDGYKVLEHLRKHSDVPVLMLTALHSELDQIKAFDLQADDYVPKPFSLPILIRKIESILRRVNKLDKKIIHYHELLIDLEGMVVKVNEQEIKLTVKEYEILCAIFLNPGIVMTREMLVTKIWGDESFCDDRIINIHIKNIRKKLGVDYIKTIRGAGYKIDRLP